MTEIEIRPAGDRAILLEPVDPDRLAGLVDRLRDNRIEGVEDVLPAARTVLATLLEGADPAVVAARLRAVAAAVTGTVAAMQQTAPVPIPVSYDGPDLTETAALLDISPADLVARHTRAIWRCAFVGFAPGFGYLEAPDSGLAVPRRDRSRTAVPAGSVALAGGYSAVYPRRSPGGWRLIGRTGSPLWDLARPEPALLRPGTRVRFVAVDDMR